MKFFTAYTRLLVVLTVLALLLGCAAAPAIPTPVATTASAATPAVIYWPTNGWRTSTPEQQGMDSAQVAAFFETVAQNKYDLHSAVIIRHGAIVAETYRSIYGPDVKHFEYSVTKSVTSILVGIAIDKGYLKGADQKLLSLFPNRSIANNDDSKQSITLENVLDMTSGFKWSESGAHGNSYTQMLASPDWAQFLLDQPMVANPGKRFEYNTGGPHLLTTIVAQASHMPALDFAQRYLFTPLGISDVSWAVDPQGTVEGGNNLQLRPRDAAKIGYLYLHNGQWEGQQIVSASWVQASTQPHVTPPGNGSAYGYLWWILPFEAYSAVGYGGQYVLVAPDKDLVVVLNAWLDPSLVDRGVLPTAIKDHILPAVQSAQPLPDNPQGIDRLKAALR